ncbi:MAG: hypothetical protein O9327_03150 [Polaromonas sp.]|nr:hypothetical protein [Polaromonas sp.]
MYETYEDACEATVSRAQAQQEIARHDVDGGFEQFLLDVGDQPVYRGKQVLDWLGY